MPEKGKHSKCTWFSGKRWRHLQVKRMDKMWGHKDLGMRD